MVNEDARTHIRKKKIEYHKKNTYQFKNDWTATDI